MDNISQEEKERLRLFLNYTVEHIAARVDDHDLLLGLLEAMINFNLSSEQFLTSISRYVSQLPESEHSDECKIAIKQLTVVRNEMVSLNTPRAVESRKKAQEYFAERIQELIKTIDETFHPSNEKHYNLQDVSEIEHLLERIHQLLTYSIPHEKIFDFLVLMQDFSITPEEYEKRYTALSKLFERSHNIRKLMDVFEQFSALRKALHGSSAEQKMLQSVIISYLAPYLKKITAERKHKELEAETQERINTLLTSINQEDAEHKVISEQQKKIQQLALQRDHDNIVAQQKERREQLKNEIEDLREKLQGRHDLQITEQKNKREKKRKIAALRQRKLQQRHDEQMEQWKAEKHQISDQMLAMQEEKKRQREDLHKEHVKRKAKEKLTTQQKIAERKKNQESQYQIRLAQKQDEFLKSQERIKAMLEEQDRQQQVRQKDVEDDNWLDDDWLDNVDLDSIDLDDIDLEDLNDLDKEEK